MIGFGIAAVVIIAIMLFRFGATAEYSDDGLVVLARAGFIKFKLFPKKQKRKSKSKREKRKPREHRKKEEREAKTAVKKPGLSFDLKKLIDEGFKVLNKVRRRLLIKDLTVLYVMAGGDPCKMAVSQGAALTALGLTQATLESFFKVKHYNLHTSVDFIAHEPRVYVYATLTIAVWEAIYIGIAGLMLVLRSRKPKENADEAAITDAKVPEEVKGQ